MRTEKENKQIANTILVQLGGVEFVLCTGAKRFLLIDSGVRFHIGENQKRVSTVTVRLNGNDMYDLQFEDSEKVLSKYTDIFCENLKDLFEESTGLYVSLRPRQ